MLNILLACGGGMSSSFVAKGIRKAAKARNIEVNVEAVSDNEVFSLVDDFDVLLIGPHISYRLPEFIERYDDGNRVVDVINQKDYAKLDGEAILIDLLQRDRIKQKEGEK